MLKITAGNTAKDSGWEKVKKTSHLINVHREWEPLKLHILPQATSKLSQFLCFYKSDMLLNHALSVSTSYQWCNFPSQLGKKKILFDLPHSTPTPAQNLFHLFGWCFALEISTSSTCPVIWTARSIGAKDKSFLQTSPYVSIHNLLTRLALALW